MFEVLSKMRSSMIVPQGNPLLAAGFSLPTARRPIPITLQPFLHRTTILSRLRKAMSQAYGIARGLIVTWAVWAALLGPWFAAPAYAETGTVRFDNISTEQGLSQSTVTAILQDHQGFMWFGTEDGLNQYDGYHFTVYRHDPDDPASLSDNVVYSIYESRSGELWVGTASGLDRFDRATATFAHYRHEAADPESLSGEPVTAILEDHAGALWVGTEDGGLDRLDWVTDGFAHYQHAADDPQSLSDNAVYSIYQDRGGELWIGTLSGLDRLDQMTGLFTHYRLDPTNSHIVGDYTVNDIYEDRQGALWIGTRGDLVQFDRSQNRFVEYRHEAGDPCSLSSDSVRSVYEDSRGTLWIGTRSGLDRLDQSQNCFIHYRHDPNDLHSLISDSIRAMYEDRSGILWIGTSGGGLSKYSQAAQRFALYRYNPGLPHSLSDNNVWAIHEDRSGILWVGTFSAGLNRLDRRSGAVAIYRHQPSEIGSLSSDEVRVILEDTSGVLWVGTEHGGLNRFDPKTETFFHYRREASDPGSLSDDDVFALYEDRQGTLWIGTQQGGLNRLDRESESFVHYQHDATNPFSLGDNHVETIYQDHLGVLWIGTLGGIDLLDNDRKQFTHYRHEPQDPASLSNNKVTSIYESPDGTVWIGTLGGGLNRFDRAAQTFTHYTIKDGLPDDTVYGILPDAEGRLWLSTNKGLSRFDPRRGAFRNYDSNDGLQGDQFNVRAYSKGTDGELFFGGTQGFNAFFPEQVTDNLVPPLVVVTAFGILNQTVQTNLTANEHIQLSYKDYLISFEFAALDYNAPARNQYAYMLDGVDRDWVYAGTRRYASYTNLSGGDYVFRVKASNSDGIWSSEGTALRISITPPFWHTWWFIGIVGLVVAVGVMGGYRLRVRSIEAQSRKLEKRVERRTYELATLNTIAAVVSRSLDLAKILEDALSKTMEIMRMNAGLAFCLEDTDSSLPDGPSFSLLAHRGVSNEFVSIFRSLPVHSTLVGMTGDVDKPIVWHNANYPNLRMREANEREGIRLGISIPLLVKGKLVGVVCLGARETRTITPEESSLLLAIGQQVGLAVENAKLYQQAEQSAAMEERSRLARELHDSVTQSLYSVTMYTEAAARLLTTGQETTAAEYLRDARDTAQEALREMRLMIYQLRPPLLEKGGLAVALQVRLDAVERRGGIHAELIVEGQDRLPPAIQTELHQIAQEALNNALKHAHAREVQVRLHFGDAATSLEVQDDGMGFELAAAQAGGGLGLPGMEERVLKIGGRLTIESAPGQGTRVLVEVPSGGEG
jgi:signal transduction histidine kinase/ligand-binding sensor domain-containing protein